MTMADGLIWSPVYKALEDPIGRRDGLALIIVPFAKVDALKRLHWIQTRQQKLKIVYRWTPEDLASGASDLEVFTYLKENGCELYVNQTVHLKLYVFASNSAFQTSGNLTLRGLGYSIDPNIEVGNFVALGQEDWARIYQVVEAFRKAPFVVAFVDLLKSMKRIRFGTVNAWIHHKCEDVPLPYRWEIKENTRTLYDWLAYFFPEITWDVPGRHSQVIYWNK